MKSSLPVAELSHSFPYKINLMLTSTFIVLFLSCLHLSNTKDRTIDWNFARQILRSYLCTGDREWWRNIEKNRKVLKFLMHAGIELYCDRDSLKYRYQEDMGELIEDARSAVKQQSLEKRKEVSECLWKGLRYWHLEPIVCPFTSEKFMEEFDMNLRKILEEVICAKKRDIFWEIGCLSGSLALRNIDALRQYFRPYLCKTHRQRRQYDVASIKAIIDQVACLKSTEHDLETVVIEDGNNFHFSRWGIFCCINMFVET